ncbi:MAG TPA: ABC transporter permease [Acidimicrobiales bacterium]|nr:ABC transporter permease [Acidimicrobiales bacterium]
MTLTGAGVPAAPAGRRARRAGVVNFARALRSSPKALVGVTILAIFTFMAIAPGVIAPDNPSAEVYNPSLGPSVAHLFGTTSYGQDIFSQFIWGARVSLLIAVIAGLLATVLSVLIGVSAAYLGGVTDGVLSLFTDVFLVIPAFPLVVVIAAYSKNGGDAIIVAVLVVTGWSYGARQLRAQALSLRNRDFLVAAQLRGERRWRIIVSEMLPMMTSLIVANFLGAAVYSVLAAAGLQFIGLGNVNTESWGTMLYWAQNNEALTSGIPLWAIAPGIGIALLGGAFALLNYAFDEVSNPALRPVRAKTARIKARRSKAAPSTEARA